MSYEVKTGRPTYKGKWKTVKKDLGIKLEINWLGNNVWTKHDWVPYETVFIGEDGKPLFSLIGCVPFEGSSQLEIMDYSNKQVHGYFDSIDVKDWLDKRGIKNRPHYREAALQIEDFYQRLKTAEEKVKELNSKLSNMEVSKERVYLFEEVVGSKGFMDSKSLEDAIERFVVGMQIHRLNTPVLTTS